VKRAAKDSGVQAGLYPQRKLPAASNALRLLSGVSGPALNLEAMRQNFSSFRTFPHTPEGRNSERAAMAGPVGFRAGKRRRPQIALPRRPDCPFCWESQDPPSRLQPTITRFYRQSAFCGRTPNCSASGASGSMRMPGDRRLGSRFPGWYHRGTQSGSDGPREASRS
jgi:hypothetical protein